MNKPIWLILAATALAGVQSTPAAVAADQPSLISFATHSVGTGGHRQFSLLAESIIEKTGIKVRMLPAGGDTARAMTARQGEADAAAFNSVTAWSLQEGLFDFSARTWGPQAVSYMWLPEHVGLAFALQGDSPIKTGADLKGKKVAAFPGSPGQHLLNEAMLAFYGLTWKDVVAVPFPGSPPAYQSVVKGKIDTCFFNVVSSAASELASMPAGIRYLQMPPEDKAGWSRLRAVTPMMFPRQSTVGGGISEKAPVWTMSQAYPAFVSWTAKVKDDNAYAVSKLMHETYPSYSTKDKSMKLDWTLEKTLNLFDQDVLPMHPGSVKYFKEIGKWTPEREKINQARLQHQKKLKAVWDETVKEAAQKNISDKDFEAFWLKKRAAAGLWAPKG